MSLPLSELTDDQWESLCDGCGKCCMVKLQDEETDNVHYTNVACRLFDEEQCQCKDYQHRTQEVPECIALTLERAHEFAWLPSTCAYRLRYESKPLPQWHPLVAGNAEMMHQANMSVQNKTFPLEEVEVLEHHLVSWR